MKTTTKGLVIKEQTIGESDRLVTLLTADYGLIRAFVRGAKQIKNKLASSTSLFAYSNFSLYRGRDSFVVDSASAIEIFFDLRKDITSLALAQYFAQLAYEFADEEQPAEELLSVLLNSLYLLCGGNKDQRIIKSAVELRTACLAGYMPDVLACTECGEYETDIMYFDIENGCLYCSGCAVPGTIPCPKNVIMAMRYICLTNPKKIFSFTLPDSGLTLLSNISEKYILSRAQRKFPTLEFYKTLL